MKRSEAGPPGKGGDEPAEGPNGTPVRPDPYLRRRIDRLRAALSGAAGNISFNAFALAALRGHCDRLEEMLGLRPLEEAPEGQTRE